MPGESTPCSPKVSQDLTGQKFGRLTVLLLEPVRMRGGARRWRCRCDCGNETVVVTGSLKRGMSRSCGCFKLERLAECFRTHGSSRTGIYWVWSGMIQRCCNPKSKYFHNYGGRGITVCREWRESFEAFQASVGPRPSPKHTIDRIDNERGYEPGNVRWSTRKEQNNNTRKNRLVTAFGETLTLSQWSERFGIKALTIRARLEKGITPEEALTKPVKKRLAQG